jgi:hypothetical protein
MIVQSLIIAGVFLAATVLLKHMAPDYLDPELARRLMGALPGIMLVLYANAIPKAVVPIARMHCDPATDQAVRRFVGWTLVLGGVAYLVAWIVVPVEQAATVSCSFLGAAMLAVVARLAWGKTKARRT